MNRVVDWNGRSVTLDVSVIPEGNVVNIKKDETTVIGDMSITYTASGTMPEDELGKPYITMQLETPLQTVEDLYLENQSFAFAGNVIRVKQITVERGVAELVVVPNAYTPLLPSAL